MKVSHSRHMSTVQVSTSCSVTRQELIGWLQHEITEQKRIDASTSGAPVFANSLQSSFPAKDVSMPSDVILLLPSDSKKQRKQVKQLFQDRGQITLFGGIWKLTPSALAFETGAQIKAAQIKSALQAGMPILAIDVPPNAFDAMSKDSTWVTDDEAWKAILSNFPSSHNTYAHQIRDAASKRKVDHQFLLLYAVREEIVRLLTM
jgi:eukaryotic translation initiation factor 2-alpha kinase 4